MGDGDQPGLGGDGGQHGLGVQITVGVHIDPFQYDTLTFAQEMPWHDVGVMFHDGQDHLIARLKPGGGPAVGHQIDRLGRAGAEHDVIGTGVQKPRNGAARRLVFVGRKVGQIVQPAVHIRIFVRICLRHRINHHLRLLGRCAIVQVNQRLAIHLT